MSNVKILLILSAFCCSSAVFAQKTIETFYFNADWDTVKTKSEAKHYQVVKTNGKQRIVTSFNMGDSIGIKTDETLYRREKSATIVGDSTWWQYGFFKQWYPSGQLKVEGTYLFDCLHGELKTYYPNGSLRRRDEYRRDTLLKGQCYAPDSSEMLYVSYKEQPKFKGGERKMFEFLANNTRYSSEAREKGIQGTVYVAFVVSKTGEIENVRVRRGVHKSLDAEAMRVIKSMPKWNAAKEEGEPVSMAYTVPITFSMM
jgi:TonB family protein